MRVTLEWFEVLLAAAVGVRCQLEALRSGRPDCHGFDGETGWQVHIEGVCGEMAFAKAVGQYRFGPSTPSRPAATRATLRPAPVAVRITT